MIKLLKSDYEFDTELGKVTVSMKMENKHRSVSAFYSHNPEALNCFWDTKLPLRPATAVKFLILFRERMNGRVAPKLEPAYTSELIEACEMFCKGLDTGRTKTTQYEDMKRALQKAKNVPSWAQ